MKRIDFDRKIYIGEYKDEEFEVTLDGNIRCFLVSDTIRDEMRLEAADAFLGSARSLGLTKDEYRFWSSVGMVDKDHPSFEKAEERRH